MSSSEAIVINVDLTNPGQFFACCGLLELADRLWGGAEGWFSGRRFNVRATSPGVDCQLKSVFGRVRGARLTNTMSDQQLHRRQELSEMRTSERRRMSGLEEEKKELDRLWREEPILFHEPFNMRIDWFLDVGTGGSSFKTWAGQQSVIDISTVMKQAADEAPTEALAGEDWLTWMTDRDDLGFKLDSDLGAQASDLDVGFSMDPLGIQRRTRPFIELFGFVGLQRFRPLPHGRENRFTYVAWTVPLPAQVAAVACCSLMPQPFAQAYEFPMLRTKYLKSFLPAQPSGDAQ